MQLFDTRDMNHMTRCQAYLHQPIMLAPNPPAIPKDSIPPTPSTDRYHQWTLPPLAQATAAEPPQPQIHLTPQLPLCFYPPFFFSEIRTVIHIPPIIYNGIQVTCPLHLPEGRLHCGSDYPQQCPTAGLLIAMRPPQRLIGRRMYPHPHLTRLPTHLQNITH